MRHLEANYSTYLAQLRELVGLPTVSVGEPNRPALAQCAEAVRDKMVGAGLKNVRMLRCHAETSPYVYGEWLEAPARPTVLFYSHYDVVPVDGDWTGSPWELSHRDGRLFGRGASDDKGAVIAQLAAVDALLSADGGLPVNVKLLAEGEEERGSPNLTALLREYREGLACDVVVVCDTDHLEVGLPSLTYSLRGGGSLSVSVKASDRAHHSGLTGGLLPDPARALCRLLAGLWSAEDNRIAVPAYYDAVRPLTGAEHQSIYRLPCDEARLLRDYRQVPGATLAKEPGLHPYHQVWRRPSISISALEASSVAKATNQILGKADAVLNLRIVPDQDPDDAYRRVERFLKANVPWHLEVTVEATSGFAAPWICRPEGAVFEAAIRALQAGYGRAPVPIGSGGSIPFVGPFSSELGGIPMLLFPIGDPDANVHSVNESLHVESWKQLMRSLVCFLREAAALAGQEAG